MSEEPARLFDWLTAIHKRWGWTQKQLADACQVTPNTMRGWRNGSLPDRATLAAIAAAVGVTIDDLHRVMEGQDVPVPDVQPGADQDVDVSQRLTRLEARVETLTDLVLRLQASR